MESLLERYKAQTPEIVFEWHDPETDAEGWIVINSLRGGAAGGGTRMREGLTREEVISLAKVMEIKFSVCGPPIGGA
ncbi:MAG: amino acid dehydrogenase, partial [Saprospiraceae bacterium]|nr:amino acid dehydrogenase [Saprospiraceae bacterium]